MAEGDRNSLAEFGAHTYGAFKAVYKSRGLQALFGAALAAATAFMTWNGGFDAGVNTKLDPETIEKRLTSLSSQDAALAAKIASLENVLGETQADAIAALERVRAGEASRLKIEQRIQEKDSFCRERTDSLWLAVVLTNAPKNRSDLYFKAFKARRSEGRDSEVAAYMTLGWGSVR